MNTSVVSSAPSADPTIRRSVRVLAMVHELHKAGFQRLRIAPGRSPRTMHWRVRLLPSSAVLKDGWTPVGEPWSIDYSSEQEAKFFGWDDTTTDDARSLANKFIDRIPELGHHCWGRDWSYAGWFTEMLGRAEAGHLPVFYGAGPLSAKRHMPPGPLDASEGDAEWPANPSLLSDDELETAILPRPGAPYERVWPFCLSYDAEHGGLMSVSDYEAMAREAEQKGLANATLDELRTYAYAHQRILKNSSGEVLPGDPSMVAIHQALEVLRRRLAGEEGPPMEAAIRHWSEDPYWAEALDRYHALRESGQTRIAIDLAALQKDLFDGDSPAYRLMKAMCSVSALEGEDGYRGAPRLVLALLATLSSTRPRRS